MAIKGSSPHQIHFLEWKGYEVTQVTEVTQMFFFKIKPFFRGYEVTGLRRLQGYEIAKSSIYLATTALNIYRHTSTLLTQYH